MKRDDDAMKRTTTLIAEDEPLASEGLAGWVREMPELELVGVRADGPGTLQALRTLAPELVLMDIHMPGMSGLQVLRKLKAAGQRLSIVVITAHDEPETRERCIDAGACAYLRKPLEDRLLLNAISAAMRSHSAPIKR